MDRGRGHHVLKTDKGSVPIRTSNSGILHRGGVYQQVTISRGAHVGYRGDNIGAPCNGACLYYLPESPVTFENRVKLVRTNQIGNPVISRRSTLTRYAIHIVKVHRRAASFVGRQMPQRTRRETVEVFTDPTPNRLNSLLRLPLQLIYQHRAGALLLGDVLQRLGDRESLVKENPDQSRRYCYGRSRSGFLPAFGDGRDVNVVIQVKLHRDLTS